MYMWMYLGSKHHSTLLIKKYSDIDSGIVGLHRFSSHGSKPMGGSRNW